MFIIIGVIEETFCWVGIASIVNSPFAFKYGPSNSIHKNTNLLLHRTVLPLLSEYQCSFRINIGEPDDPGKHAISTAPILFLLKSIAGWDEVIHFLNNGKLSNLIKYMY